MSKISEILQQAEEKKKSFLEAEEKKKKDMISKQKKNALFL